MVFLLFITGFFAGLLKLLMKIFFFSELKHFQNGMFLLEADNIQLILIKYFLIPFFDLKLILEGFDLFLNGLVVPPGGEMEGLTLFRRSGLDELGEKLVCRDGLEVAAPVRKLRVVIQKYHVFYFLLFVPVTLAGRLLFSLLNLARVDV
jgi:hypothetical protein